MTGPRAEGSARHTKLAAPSEPRGRAFSLPPAAAIVGAVYAAALAALSLIPVPAFVHEVGSAAAHAVAYGGLILLMFALVRGALARLVLLASVWLFGVAIEAAQALVSWRSGSVDDIVYNTYGIAAAASIFVVAEGAWALARAGGR